MHSIYSSLETRGSLPIRHNWPLWLSLTVVTLQAKICRPRHFFEGGGSLWAQIWDGRERRPPTTVGVRKLNWLRFRVRSGLFVFVTKNACDGRTDRITTLKTALACSRGKNWRMNDWIHLLLLQHPAQLYHGCTGYSRAELPTCKQRVIHSDC